MNSKTVNFTNPQSLIAAAGSPWTSPHRTSFADLVLKPEYADRIHRFPTGISINRVVPAVSPSQRGWILGAHIIEYAGGRHLHPRTLPKPGGKCVFDVAYRWLRNHQPEVLFSKMNPLGYRILANPYSILWLLTDQAGPESTASKTTAKLVVASAYDGARGGVAGMGYLIWKLFQERDEAGELIADPSDPETCPHLVVERVQPKGARYPSYSLRLGRSPSPIGDWLDRMEPAELDLIKPLDQVIHIPEPDEEWKLLEKVLPTDLVSRIREEC